MTAVARAVQTSGATDSLGQIVWFSVAARVERDEDGNRVSHPVMVTFDDLEAWFEELDLDPAFLPTKIAAVNAFRTASSKIGAEYDTDVPGQRVRLIVEEVKADNEQIVRQILREVLDSRRAKVHQDKAGELRFSRGRRSNAGRISGSERWYATYHSRLPERELEIIKDQVEQFKQRYETQTVYRDDNDVRTILREYLRSLDAIVVEPSKGIYFVTNEVANTVAALAEFLRRVGPGCSLHTVPLVDTVEQRTMLFDAFREQMEDEVRVLIRDIERYRRQIKDGPAAPVKASEFNARWHRLLDRRDETCATLGLVQECADDALEDARLIIVELSQRIGTVSRRR